MAEGMPNSKTCHEAKQCLVSGMPVSGGMILGLVSGSQCAVAGTPSEVSFHLQAALPSRETGPVL